MKKIVLVLVAIFTMSLVNAQKVERVKKSIERSESKKEIDRTKGFLFTQKDYYFKVRIANKKRRVINQIERKNVKLQVAILESNLVKVSRVKR